MCGWRARVTNSNKQYHVNKNIADCDACSLYPSAMYKMKGFLEGKPKVLGNTSYEFLKQQDGYFIIIKIIQLNKHLYCPLTSNINEETGVRDFINEMEHDIIYIYKISLEDLITFHDGQCEIIGGYYYDGRMKRLIMLLKIYIIQDLIENISKPSPDSHYITYEFSVRKKKQ